MKDWKKLFLVGMLALVLVLPACAPRAEVTTTLPENSTWKLVSISAGGTERPAREGAEVTLSFQPGGQMGGNSGCNSYGGSYRLDGQKIQLGDVMSTLMACADAGVMEQEQAYLAALQQSSAYRLSGDRLTLLDGDTALLTFARK